MLGTMSRAVIICIIAAMVSMIVAIEGRISERDCAAAVVSVFYDLSKPMVCFVCKAPEGSRDVFETHDSRDECWRITHKEYAISLGSACQGQTLQIVCEDYGESAREYTKIAGNYIIEHAGKEGNLLYISKHVHDSKTAKSAKAEPVQGEAREEPEQHQRNKGVQREEMLREEL